MGDEREGGLTAAQFEIMQVAWDAPEGVTVADVWEAVSRGRGVARTTVLNLVGRLEKRGWLRRQSGEGPLRYVAAVDRDEATAGVAAKFVDEYFGGSAADLVMSLLGSQRLSAADVDELRRLLNLSRRTRRDP